MPVVSHHQTFMTWEQFEHACSEIAKFFEGSGIEVKDIYGIPKGGLPAAVRLAHLLDRPLIIDAKKISKKTLIVDDIIDTGRTTEKYRKRGLMLVSLYYNPSQCPYVPLCWVYQKVRGWIVFPWERK